MPQISVHRDHLLAGLLLVLAGGVYTEAAHVRSLGSSIGVVDATFFPKLVAALIALCAVIIAFQAKKTPAARLFFTCTRETRRVLLFVVLLGTAIFAVPEAGFEVVSVGFLCLAMRTLGMRRVPLMLGIAFGLTGLIYLVFVKVMFVPLPSVFNL